MKLATRRLNLYYGDFWALKNVELDIEANRITAIVGPSGCGKSTLLRVFNRMNDLLPGVRTTGQVMVDGVDIHRPGIDLIGLRRKVGMVFQRPNVFPLSVWENATFGPHVHGTRTDLGALVEKCLRRVHLWDELKDRLHKPALALTLEQQQRLCIARLVAVQPEVLLMDEPCSALDPVATQAIEELMRELKARYTIVIVTHNMQQAARVSDDTIYMLLGELIEHGATEVIFTKPRDKRTEDYLTGRFG